MRRSKVIYVLLLCTFLSLGLVITLFHTSEEIIHRNNSLIRRYPHHPVSKLYDIDLGYNSYYFAGYDRKSLYLGNITAPLHLIQVNRTTRDTCHIRLRPEGKDQFKFQSVKIRVIPPNYFLIDGTVPVVFRGETKNWTSTPITKHLTYFSLAQPISENDLVFRGISSKTGENELGKLKLNSNDLKLYPKLLEKQVDGLFDTDGMLLHNVREKKLIYVYYYRNEFLVMDKELNLLQRAKTIDTISKAKIDIAKLQSGDVSTLNSRPIIVNRSSATSGSLLFIKSERLGKYEPKEMLGDASIIDVYNLDRSTYEFSFYLYNLGKNSAREFIVQNNKLYALIGEHLVVHKLKPKHFDEILISSRR